MIPTNYSNWNDRTDFNGVSSIAYFCDDGHLINVDVAHQNAANNKVFVNHHGL